MFSGYVAWQAWRATYTNNLNEHVHKLFIEYLKIRLEHSVLIKGASDAVVKRINSDAAGTKLYIMEEMHFWVATQRKLQHKFDKFNFFNLLQSRKEKNSMTDNINSWEKTIISHIMQDFETTRESILDYTCCYSAAFVFFVAEISEDDELLKTAQDHLSIVTASKPRHMSEREELVLKTSMKASIISKTEPLISS